MDFSLTLALLRLSAGFAAFNTDCVTHYAFSLNTCVLLIFQRETILYHFSSYQLLFDKWLFTHPAKENSIYILNMNYGEEQKNELEALSEIYYNEIKG